MAWCFGAAAILPLWAVVWPGIPWVLRGVGLGGFVLVAAMATWMGWLGYRQTTLRREGGDLVLRHRWLGVVREQSFGPVTRAIWTRYTQVRENRPNIKRDVIYVNSTGPRRHRRLLTVVECHNLPELVDWLIDEAGVWVRDARSRS
jgi:hypothetical protein